MKRSTSVWASMTCAAALLVAGCSSSVQGTAQAGSSASSATSTSTTATTTRTTEESTTSDESTSEESPSQESETTSQDSETAASSGLDSDTENWFIVFCTQTSEFQQYASPDTAGQTLAEAQVTVADAYSNLSISASTTVGVLQATPPPPIDGGNDLQTGLIERFSVYSDVYGRGALTILGLTPTSETDLVTAIDAIEAEAKAAAPTDMAQIDPAVLDAARALPECQGVL